MLDPGCLPGRYDAAPVCHWSRMRVPAGGQANVKAHTASLTRRGAALEAHATVFFRSVMAVCWRAHGALCVANQGGVHKLATRGAACRNRYHQVSYHHRSNSWKPSDMSESANRPLPAGMLALGWAGVLPFAFTLAWALYLPTWHDRMLHGFVDYAALILSFLGGARWGRGLAGPASPWRYVEAVVPSLVGFAALLLRAWPMLALALLAGGYLLWLVIDLVDPRWTAAYRRMRLGISVVVLCLHAGWLLA